MSKSERSEVRSTALRRSSLADHAAFAVWIAAYVAVLAIIFAPKGAFTPSGAAGAETVLAGAPAP